MATYKSKRPYLYGTGRRKSSVARVHLIPEGTGTIPINGTEIDEQTVTVSGYMLDDTKIVLKDTAGQRVNLKDLIKGSTTLIYRYSDRYCDECVDYAFHVLNRSKCDKKRVIYIGDCGKRKIFKRQVEDYGLQGIALDCRSLEIPAEEMLFPYFLVVDSTLVIRCIYVPNKASYYQNIDSLNLALMQRRFLQ